MVKRESESVPRTEEFKRIPQLEPDTVEKLEKIRNDLETSVERTVRISDAFLRELHKHAQISNRVKLVIRAANDIQFHADCQRSHINKKISNTLNWEPPKPKKCDCDLF
ncbi:hypothetical protein PsorP6_016097 [Peronosclerospora sorghi]|uniref:Uncharacterized protein n=1 Tax=Peronosclerospora sorghi TaxID=230839 RepID=A0ACC0WNR2_9STRA|nr:hypothetical protein PsorP6_016097 [Peronosclerospora sorghi]